MRDKTKVVERVARWSGRVRYVSTTYMCVASRWRRTRRLLTTGMPGRHTVSCGVSCDGVRVGLEEVATTYRVMGGFVRGKVGAAANLAMKIDRRKRTTTCLCGGMIYSVSHMEMSHQKVSQHRSEWKITWR